MRRDIVRALKAIGERKVRLTRQGALPAATASAAEAVVCAASIDAMVSEGLLSRVRGSVERTAEGRAYLRRALASGPDEPFRAQHQHCVTRLSEDTATTAAHTVTVNAAESPLAWLATRSGRNGTPLVSHTQKAAGDRLARDFERGHHRQRVTQSWDASGVRGGARRDGLSVSEGAEAARNRVESALRAVGPGLADALLSVCCEEIGLEATEKKFGWPARSGKLVLTLALDRLAAHYGMASRAVGSGCGLVHWGGEGYRPKA